MCRLGTYARAYVCARVRRKRGIPPLHPFLHSPWLSRNEVVGAMTEATGIGPGQIGNLPAYRAALAGGYGARESARLSRVVDCALAALVDSGGCRFRALDDLKRRMLRRGLHPLSPLVLRRAIEVGVAAGELETDEAGQIGAAWISRG